MKITDIKQYLCNIPMGPGGRFKRTLHFVKVETDEDIYGFGEATLRVKTPAIYECIELLKRNLIGVSIYNVEDWFHRYFYTDAWRNGVIMNTAISGVEIAVWDAIGKKMGLPVYQLLGGKVRDKVKVYHSGLFPMERSPKGYAEAAKLVKGRGYDAFKYDPIGWGAFGQPLNEGEIHTTITRKDLEECVEVMAAVREAIGPDIDILLECHAKMNFDQALWLIRNLEPYKLGFIEEPIQPDNWEGFRKLAYKSNIPIATGERLFMRWGQRRLIEEGVASIIQPDFTHTGGILESRKIAANAEAYYMRTAPHNSSGPVATMAAVMVDATTPNLYCQEFAPGNMELGRYFKKFINFKDGYILLDDNVPGIGIEPDFEAIEADCTGYTQNMRDW